MKKNFVAIFFSSLHFDDLVAIWGFGLNCIAILLVRCNKYAYSVKILTKITTKGSNTARVVEF